MLTRSQLLADGGIGENKKDAAGGVNERSMQKVHGTKLKGNDETPSFDGRGRKREYSDCGGVMKIGRRGCPRCGGTCARKGGRQAQKGNYACKQIVIKKRATS